MKISHEFEVNRSPDVVWEFFQDIPEVAKCLPGAELTEDKGDNAYAGTVSVKLGPMSATFEGEATVVAEPDAKAASITGKGVDKRGGSRGQVAMTYSVAAAGAGSNIAVDADVKLSGAAAQFGRTGLINEMSTRLIAEFVECLEAKLGAESAEQAEQIQAEEVRGFTLFLSSLWASIVKFFKKFF